jgi:hypothetical protein
VGLTGGVNFHSASSQGGNDGRVVVKHLKQAVFAGQLHGSGFAFEQGLVRSENFYEHG